MRYLLLLLFALGGPAYAWCQPAHLKGKVVDRSSNKGFGGATVLFRQDELIITGGVTDSAGTFVVAGFPAGNYTVTIEAAGYRTETIASVAISTDTLLPTFPFAGSCQYQYAAQQRVVCPVGHTDYIVPMVYGLPGKKQLVQAQKQKVYLAGCQLTGCDPKFYCLIHKKEL